MELTCKYIGDFIDYVRNRVVEEESEFNQNSEGFSLKTEDFENGNLSEISDEIDYYSISASLSDSKSIENWETL